MSMTPAFDDTTGPNPRDRSARALIGRIDALLHAQIQVILDHPEFRALEASWRGLHALVVHAGSVEALKIRVLDLAKPALRRCVVREAHLPAHDRSLHRLIAEAAYRDDEEPFGLLIADIELDRSPQDLDLSIALAELAQAAPVPLIAGVAPALLDLSSWADLPAPTQPFGHHGLGENVAWQRWRQKASSRFVFLTLPRVRAHATRTRSAGHGA